MGRWAGHANVPAGEYLSIRVSINDRHAMPAFPPPLPPGEGEGVRAAPVMALPYGATIAVLIIKALIGLRRDIPTGGHPEQSALIRPATRIDVPAEVSGQRILCIL